MNKNPVIYFAGGDKGATYLLGNLDFCAKSERTFDLKFNDLARNKRLIDLMGLVSMYADARDGVRWFASYLSAFDPTTKGSTYPALLNNPPVRILATSDEFHTELAKILTPHQLKTQTT